MPPEALPAIDFVDLATTDDYVLSAMKDVPETILVKDMPRLR